MNPHKQQQPQLMRPVVGSPIMNQTPCNQSTSHIQQQHHQSQQTPPPPPHQAQSQHQQQQKSRILPLLLSPRPPSLKSAQGEQVEHSENDHDQIIDQVISLENEYSDPTVMSTNNVIGGSGVVMSHPQQQQQQQPQHPHQQRPQDHQQQHHHQPQHLQQQLMSDMNLGGDGMCLTDSNQLSSSSEDLLNLLLELDREPSNLIGIDGSQQLDQDEKVGIETIRKQLMSCEMQSDPNQTSNSMSTIVNPMNCQQQQPNVAQQQLSGVQQQPVTPHQLVPQATPVMTHHSQSHQVPTSGPSQQQMSSDQTMLHGSYSSVSMSPVPVSSSGQSYATQQHQHVARISQANPMSIVNNSPSPSWQQPQLSPFSPQTPHNNSRTPSQRQGQQQQQHHSIHQQPHAMQQQHPPTTSPQMQQLLNNPLPQRSPSQSVSPPATTEPSPVVKKNPLLNAQLINSRAPSLTPTRFMNNTANVLNQNPILNAKLSQSPFVTSSSGTVGSPVNPSLNAQSRFIPQTQQTTNFSYDITQQQSNAQQHTPQAGHVALYGQSEQHQTANQIFRTTNTTPTSLGGGGTSLPIGDTSPGGGLSQQVKQEIRRKVQQQPKQQQQTTSLLKQLLSDDNK